MSPTFWSEALAFDGLLKSLSLGVVHGFLLSIAALVATSACASENQGVTLSRAGAARIIVSRLPGPIATVELTTQALDGGQKEELWTCSRVWPKTNCVLTAEGQEYFSAIDGTRRMVTLREPLRVEVTQVTGIADGTEGHKEVHFQWRLVGLSDTVARYVGQDSHLRDGNASLRLWDDGWRVELVDVDLAPRTAFRYSTETLTKFRKAEVARQELETRARTPTQTLASYTLAARHPGGAVLPGYEYRLTITDTNFTATDPDGSSITAWYMDCEPPETLMNYSNTILSGYGARFSVTCSFTRENRRTRGAARVQGMNVEQVRRAHSELDKAYKEWRSKYPTLVASQ